MKRQLCLGALFALVLLPDWASACWPRWGAPVYDSGICYTYASYAPVYYSAAPPVYCQPVYVPPCIPAPQPIPYTQPYMQPPRPLAQPKAAPPSRAPEIEKVPSKPDAGAKTDSEVRPAAKVEAAPPPTAVESKIPKIEVPKPGDLKLPPFELPKIDGVPSETPKDVSPKLPAIEVPKVDLTPKLPPIELPKDVSPKLPPLELPKDDKPKLPSLELPKDDKPKLPPLELPKVGDIKLPPLELPRDPEPKVPVVEPKVPVVEPMGKDAIPVPAPPSDLIPAPGLGAPKTPDALPPLTLPPDAPIVPDAKPNVAKSSPLTGLARELKVNVFPATGTLATNGLRKIGFYNHTERELTLTIEGKPVTLPAKSFLHAQLPSTFTWKHGDTATKSTVPADATGLDVVFRD